MSRTSTTAKITRRMLNLLADWCGQFRQGVLIRHRGEEVAFHNHKSERDCILRDSYTIRKSTLATIAHELAEGTLCSVDILLRALTASESPTIEYLSTGKGWLPLPEYITDLETAQRRNPQCILRLKGGTTLATQ